MSLVLSALLVSGAIALFTLLPWFLPGVRNYSRFLLVSGSAVLFGFCFFDLIPEMIEMGGRNSLFIMLLAWGLFSLFHRLQESHSHGIDPTEHGGMHLVSAMAMHCFSGGMFLVTSFHLSERLALHVFWGLFLHKAFEAVSVSSVLLERFGTRRQVYVSTFLYAASFPAGVLVTMGGLALFEQSLTAAELERIAVVISSVAVGSLLGCLIQDFMVPAVREVRRVAAMRVG